MPIRGIILLAVAAVVIAAIFHKEIYTWVKETFTEEENENE